MKEIIGIDVGGSTTKIVAFRSGKMLAPQFIRADDPLTALYGAFGKFTTENDLELSDIKKIIMTGVGSSFADKPIYGLPCEKASEFECVGRGGLYLSGLDEAIVISMGTGTALVHAKKSGDDVKVEYLGGTGVGGGTLVGLSKKMLGMDTIDHIEELAKTGDLSNVDLKISDISSEGALSLSANMTASNFGNLSDIASGGDIALGVINMIYEVAAMLGIFAARNKGIKNIVLTGNISHLSQAKSTFDTVGGYFDMNFIIPENSRFATAIGAALLK